jgi:hypothetical protein
MATGPHKCTFYNYNSQQDKIQKNVLFIRLNTRNLCGPLIEKQGKIEKAVNGRGGIVSAQITSYDVAITTTMLGLVCRYL